MKIIAGVVVAIGMDDESQIHRLVGGDRHIVGHHERHAFHDVYTAAIDGTLLCEVQRIGMDDNRCGIVGKIQSLWTFVGNGEGDVVWTLRTFTQAYTTINAGIWINNHLLFTFMESTHWANFGTSTT